MFHIPLTSLWIIWWLGRLLDIGIKGLEQEEEEEEEEEEEGIIKYFKIHAMEYVTFTRSFMA